MPAQTGIQVPLLCFELVRQKGSHRHYEGFHSGRRPHSLSDDVSRGTLASMIRQSGLPKMLFR